LKKLTQGKKEEGKDEAKTDQTAGEADKAQ